MCGLQEGLTEILELVLDQELQKYNHLLEEMRDSLESALCGIEGLNLVTDEIGQLLESIKQGELRQKYDNLVCSKLLLQRSSVGPCSPEGRLDRKQHQRQRQEADEEDVEPEQVSDHDLGPGREVLREVLVRAVLRL